MLFGEVQFKEKPRKDIPKLTLTQMAENEFEGPVLKELKIYLKSRRESCNNPTKTSWQLQLSLLKKVPDNMQASQVQTATLKGWRSVAFVDTKNKNNKCNTNVTRAKATNQVCSTGF